MFKNSLALILFLYTYPIFALDADSIRYAPLFLSGNDYVLIGNFENLPSEESKNVIGSNQFFLKSFRVDDVLKGVRVKGARIQVRLPNTYRLLDEPAKLMRARMEERRLMGCKSVLIGEFIRNPNDKTFCEKTTDEIDSKLNDPKFRAKAILGYLLERGWNLNFNKNQQYLVFLKKDENDVFYFDKPQFLIPLDDEKAEDIQAILFPKESE